MNDLPNLPLVRLSGSDAWEEAYGWGKALEEAFPDQEGVDFAYAVAFNGWIPSSRGVTRLVCEQVGVYDEESWIWLVTLEDNTSWRVEGGCDFTGWDCQSWVDWSQIEA